MKILLDENDVYNYTNKSHEEKKIYGSLHGKFEIGDCVKLINSGQTYSSYNFMAKAMNIHSKEWNPGSANNGDVGTVVGRKVHEDKSDILYGVSFNGIYIVGERGLELTTGVRKFTNKDFEI